jgi:transcriptional regulator with XRE-family HTH domain|nr:MAG TPA: helix-turn-helix domain protein [Caudoviricetes sp.]
MSTRIADARKAIGMTQRTLAEKLGIAASTLNGYEKGNHKPDSDVLIAVSSITGCTIDYLLNRVDGFHDYYGKEKAPAPAKAETGEITREMSIELLKALGLLDQSGNLSDDDLAFLAHIVGLLEWRFGDHS